MFQTCSMTFWSNVGNANENCLTPNVGLLRSATKRPSRQSRRHPVVPASLQRRTVLRDRIESQEPRSEHCSESWPHSSNSNSNPRRASLLKEHFSLLGTLQEQCEKLEKGNLPHIDILTVINICDLFWLVLENRTFPSIKRASLHTEIEDVNGMENPGG